jgi:N-methylhydantoinase A
VFGGAGALHGAALARELSIPTVVVPPRPGAWSALGCLMVDIRHDLSSMFLAPAADAADADVEAAFAELEEEGRRLLATEGVPEDAVRLERSIAMRYLGQWRSMEVPVEAPLDLQAAQERFHREHEREFSYRRDDAPIELYRLQLAAVGATEEVRLPRQDASAEARLPEPVSTRDVWFDGRDEPVPTPVYDRARSRRACSSPAPPSSTSSTPRRSSRPASSPRSTRT